MITLAQARTIADSALQHARAERMPPMTVAVLDATGRLVALQREDRSSLLREHIAQAKAWSALGLGVSPRRAPGEGARRPVLVIAPSAVAKSQASAEPAGVLVRSVANEILGAVGVSGHMPDHDDACAITGIEAAGLSADPGSLRPRSDEELSIRSFAPASKQTPPPRRRDAGDRAPQRGGHPRCAGAEAIGRVEGPVSPDTKRRRLVRMQGACVMSGARRPAAFHRLWNKLRPLPAMLPAIARAAMAPGLRKQDPMRVDAILRDLTHDAIITRSLDDRITSWNRGAEELYGWAPERVLGARLHELLHTRGSGGVAKISAELLRVGYWEGELAQRRRDGAQVVVASRWVVRRDSQGRPVEILESNTDITNRKRADAELRCCEARYRAIFEGARVGIWSGDYSGVKARLDELVAAGALTGRAQDIAGYARATPDFVPDLLSRVTDIDVNDAMVRMAGARDRAELVVRLAETLTPEALAPFSNLLQALLAQDAGYESEAPLRTLAGEPLPAWMSVTFVREADGRDRVLITVTDLRARRAAEEALARAQADLAHANRLATFGEFTATIAHEVNQPLAAISANGEAALRWLDRPEPDLGEARSALERIIRDGRRASEVVAGIRGMLKRAEPQIVCLDVGRLVEDAARLVKRELQARRATLTLDIASDLPAVLGDPVQLQQVLINLLINGAQAMAATAGPRTLDVRVAWMDEATVLVQVRDRGVGIPEENLGRLFGAFFTTKPDGMGMGLAICRSTIEAHGGRIWAARPDGPGALIAFSLPAAKTATA